MTENFKDGVMKVSFNADEKLGLDNWLQWRDRVELVCTSRGLAGHLDGTTPRPIATVTPGASSDPPDDEYAKNLATWQRHDSAVIMLICMNVRDWISTGVEWRGRTAFQVWGDLRARREQRNDLTALNADDWLRALRMPEGGDLQAHFSELRTRRGMAKQCGSTMTDNQFAAVICQSMPATLQPFIATMIFLTDPEAVFTGIATVYQAHLGRAGVVSNPLKRHATLPPPIANDVHTTALLAKTADIVCEWCGWKKHTRATCYCAGGGRAGQQPATWTRPPRPKAGSPADVAMNNGPASAHLSTALTPPAPPISHDDPSAAYFVNVCLLAAHVSVSSAPELTAPAYADSGASHHYFLDRTMFTEYVPILPRWGKGAKKGAPFRIVGMGTVHITMLINGRMSVLILKNVYHAPELSANLVSIPRLDQSGYTTTIEAGVLDIHQRGARDAVVLRGTLSVHGLYAIDIIPSDPALTTTLPHVEVDCDPRAFAVVQASDAAGADLDTWHRRFGHNGETIIQRMAAQNVVEGLKIVGDMPLGKCEDCIYGKHRREPFQDAPVESKPGERIFIDLMGPFRTVSLGGNRFLFTADDGGSAYHHNTPLKSKEPAATWAAFSEFLAYVERHLGRKTKYVYKPNVAHLRPFGTPGYVKVPDALRTKLGTKSTKMHLVGYTSTAHYRMWDPSTNHVVTSRDVIFAESTGHRTLPSTSFSPPADVPFVDYLQDLENDDRNQEGTTAPIATHAPDNIPPAPSSAPISPPPPPFEPVLSEPTISDNPTLHASPENAENPAPASPMPLPPALPPTAPVTLRQSSRVRLPSRRGEESLDYVQREQLAATTGNAWALDNEAAADEEFSAYATRSAATPDGDYIWEGGATPLTYKEAMAEENIWSPAMKREHDGLMKIGAWKLVERRPGMNVVGCKWAFARKFDEESRWKAKARIVAKGFHQIHGVDYFETHASVVRFEALRLVCAIGAFRDMEMGQADIEKAYLHARPQEDVYMEQPPGFIDATRPNHVYHLQRALYGLMQSGNEWWKHLDNCYDSLGFDRNRGDECVRARWDNSGLGLTATYTDDITSAHDSARGLQNITSDLNAHYPFGSKGELKYMLGIVITRDRDAGLLRLSQRPYAERVLARFGMSECNSVQVPLDPSIKLAKSKRPPTPEEEQEMAGMPYSEALGSIMYLAVATRPDLSYSVQLLSRFLKQPGIDHWRALRRVLRYIKGTLDASITYYREGVHSSTLQPAFYADSSFADCLDTGRSTHGYVSIVAGGPVSWSSRRQDVVTCSTTEAEYVAATHAGRTAQWVSKFMTDIRLPLSDPIVINTDSAGCVALSTKSLNFVKLRHIRVAYHWLRDAVRAGELAVIKINGHDNPADIFTKPLSSPTFSRHILFLGIAVQGGC